MPGPRTPGPSGRTLRPPSAAKIERSVAGSQRSAASRVGTSVNSEPGGRNFRAGLQGKPP